MKILVRYSVAPKPVTELWLKKLSAMVLRSVKGPAFEKISELSIVLTRDGEIRRLNRQYRKKDKTTDVLSFPLLEGGGPKVKNAGSLALGDVVISVPRAERQGKEKGWTLRKELAMLLIHGILHLLGYDHVSLTQEKKMFGLQDRLLKKFKV